MPLRPFTGTFTAQGAGFDFLSPRTRLNANGEVTEFAFDSYDLSYIKLTATVKDGVGHASLDSHTPLIDGIIDLNALMSNRKVDARLVCDLVNADFMRMGITKRPLNTSLKANVLIQSDAKINHRVEGTVGNIVIRDSANAYRPENIIIDMFTRRDSTHAALRSGDFALHLDGAGSIEHIMNRITEVSEELTKQRTERYIDQLRLRERFPEMVLFVSAGKNNVFSRMMKRFGYDFHNAFVDLEASPHNGLNGNVSLDSLVAVGVQLDTIRLAF